MANNKKHQSPANEWFEEIESAMKKREYSKVKEYIEAGTCCENIVEDDNFCTVTKKIWWRILNSAKRRNIDMNDSYGAKQIMGILATECSHLPLNNKQKRTAAGYIKKYELPELEKIVKFLNTPNNPDFDDRSPYLNNKDKAKMFINLLSDKDNINMDFFMKHTEDMLRFFAELPINHGDLIHFSALYNKLQNSSSDNWVQKSLFNDPADTQSAKEINKMALLKIASTYGKILTDKNSETHINDTFMNKFSSFMSAMIRKNSFSREEVKKLASAIKKQPWKSEKIEMHLMNLGNGLVDIYDKKQTIQINALNKWFNEKNKVRTTDKDILLRTYVSLLTKKLVDDTDINTLKFDDEYKNQKHMLAMRILREENGDLHNKALIAKVRKEYADETMCQITNLNLTLDTAYSNKKRMVNDIRNNLYPKNNTIFKTGKER